MQKQGDASNRLRERLDNYGASAENKAEAEKMGELQEKKLKEKKLKEKKLHEKKLQEN